MQCGGMGAMGGGGGGGERRKNTNRVDVFFMGYFNELGHGGSRDRKRD